MRQRMARVFLSSCGFLLVMTAAAKLWSVTGGDPALMDFDPILGLKQSELYVFTSAVELGVAWRCFWDDRLRQPAAQVLWLSGIFVLYRLGRLWFGDTRPCGCLGVLPGRFGLPPDVVDTIMKILLGYLLMGSGTVLMLLRDPKPVHSNREAAVGQSKSGVISAVGVAGDCSPHLTGKDTN